MARIEELEADTRPLGAPNSWARTNGAGKARLDGVDKLAAETQRKWGADRLLSSYSDIAQVKISFPGASVTEIRRKPVDKGQVGRMFRQKLELLAVQYGLSQRDYHKRRKIEQGEMV